MGFPTADVYAFWYENSKWKTPGIFVNDSTCQASRTPGVIEKCIRFRMVRFPGKPKATARMKKAGDAALSSSHSI
jgi:hypothetical protein